MKYLVKINEKEYEVEVERLDASAATQQASLENKPKEVQQASAPVKMEKQVTASSAPAGSEKVIAPIPGTILEVKVGNGQHVKKGQLLFILEAMKMENEILAARDGTVEALSVTKGASVNTGDFLLALS